MHCFPLACQQNSDTDLVTIVQERGAKKTVRPITVNMEIDSQILNVETDTVAKISIISKIRSICIRNCFQKWIF